MGGVNRPGCPSSPRLDDVQFQLSRSGREAIVVRDECLGIVADGERRRQVDRVERAQERRADVRRQTEHRLVEAQVDDCLEHAVGAVVGCRRRLDAPQRTPALDRGDLTRQPMWPMTEFLFERRALFSGRISFMSADE